jgi:16S rRNA (adenine1518-N6/adenine1519-N6)-dimethyltransferase
MLMPELASLRNSLETYGLMAKKSFGQHFLLDLNITRKIVRLGGPFSGEAVIEVGPGPGGLTRALLEADVRQLIAIEKDARFLPLLAELTALYPRLTTYEADALKVDEHQILENHGLNSAHIVSNLPYNIGTPLLIKWLTGPWRPKSMTLMFQLEVARRIVAETGADDYGRLSVIARCLCDVEKLMDLPARAFTPPPKVDSAVVKLIPHALRPAPDLIRKLEKLTAAAFGQRRKMLRASLKAYGGEAFIEAAGLDPTHRAEQLSPEDFLKLAARL